MEHPPIWVGTWLLPDPKISKMTTKNPVLHQKKLDISWIILGVKSDPNPTIEGRDPFTDPLAVFQLLPVPVRMSDVKWNLWPLWRFFSEFETLQKWSERWWIYVDLIHKKGRFHREKDVKSLGKWWSTIGVWWIWGVLCLRTNPSRGLYQLGILRLKKAQWTRGYVGKISRTPLCCACWKQW